MEQRNKKMAKAPISALNDEEMKKLKSALKEQIVSEQRKSRMAKNEEISAVYKKNGQELEAILEKI